MWFGAGGKRNNGTEREEKKKNAAVIGGKIHFIFWSGLAFWWRTLNVNRTSHENSIRRLEMLKLVLETSCGWIQSEIALDKHKPHWPEVTQYLLQSPARNTEGEKQHVLLQERYFFFFLLKNYSVVEGNVYLDMINWSHMVFVSAEVLMGDGLMPA